MTGYEFSSDPERVDRARVHGWLSELSYWAEGRDRTVTDTAFDGSRLFGLYDTDTGEQAAFCRVVTDGATFAWLADVFVDPDRRGAGLGHRLVAEVLVVLEPLRLRRVLLATADAHRLYARHGFAPLPDPERFMVRPGTPVTSSATTG
ncbi:GNAT family N-acetyltransferase [Aeromicrobium sp. PE09-221]|uniref:GNAT family N-acetyltransferase n=1 Tax=Aeromicrobium sp. PE09-221 TaxID=1898043 RepID=UPI000B3EAA0C|nr:GNAT family N-acetyltransferase [Aeromicrobium sp. PE09-221]OUZ07636.1 GNAT family N-acetyltransferase [Aeromicrobium sp. PE09-221]